MESGVEVAASYTCPNCIFTKQLNVTSNDVPNIVATATSPGAMKSMYFTPWTCERYRPSPRPIASRS